MTQQREHEAETGGGAVPGPEEDPRAGLDVLGEDVGSSPARRGHEDPEEAARRDAAAAGAEPSDGDAADAGATGAER